MFNKKNELKTQIYFISKDVVVVNYNNEILLYDKLINQVDQISIEQNFGSIFCHRGKLYGTDNYNGKLMHIKKDGNINIIEPEFNVYRNWFSGVEDIVFGFARSNNKIGKYSFKAYDLYNKKVLFENIELNVRYGVLADNIYVDHSERRDIPQCWNEIIKLSQNTGQILWRFDVSEIDKELEVSRLVGVSDGILVAGIGDEYMIGINTENGELVWKQRAIPDFDIIDHSNNVLHSLTSGYVKRDMKNGEILDLFDDKDYFEKEIGIESQRSNYVLVGDHIITTDWKKGRIGAFNTITHRFDWLYEEAGVSFPAGQAMKYFAPYLFVMDSKQMLHIFERE
jgi:hypothetical protein